MNQITRAQARDKIMDRWRDTIAEAGKTRLRVLLPDWGQMRNYEIEEYLTGIFGGEWVIAEMCPFNGTYCKHGQLHPPLREDT